MNNTTVQDLLFFVTTGIMTLDYLRATQQRYAVARLHNARACRFHADLCSAITLLEGQSEKDAAKPETCADHVSLAAAR